MPSARNIRAGAAYVELYAHDNRLVKGLRNASRRLKAFSASVRQIGMQLAKVSAVFATPLVAGVKIFADFEQQMANVATMLDEPDKHMARFRQGIRDMSVEFGESTETLAKGLWYLPYLPEAHQKGRRLTSELTDGFNYIIGGWKWIESYTDWKTFSVWSLVTGPTDPPEMQWNIFEKAIGPGITTWRDPRGKGARFNARQFEDMRELANEMTVFTLTSAAGGTQGRRRRGSAYQPTCAAALAELAGTAWLQTAYAFGIHIWHYYPGYYTHLGAQYTGQHQRASYFGFTVHPARPGYEDMTGHPCQHIYPYAKYRAYRSRYTGGSSFTMSIGREITVLMDMSETNPSPSSYEDLVSAGSSFKSGTIESSEEQTTDRTVLFSDATVYPPGTRYLILYLNNDDPTESVLCAGWSPGSGTEYSTDNFNWAAAGGVLGTFNFDKLAT